MLIQKCVSIDVVSLFIFIIGIICFCILMLIAGYFLGSRVYNSEKHIPYESGINSVGSARLRMSVKFYMVAMFFVIFDVESMFLFTWSVVIVESGWIGFIEVTIFILTLLLGLFYLIRIGALDLSTVKIKRIINHGIKL